MKKVLLALLVVSFAQVSLASNTVIVNCGAPRGFAGNAPTVKGNLKIVGHEQYDVVAGKLSVKIGRGSRATYSQKVAVKGVILDDGAIHLAATENVEVAAIYVNTNRKDQSYLELNGNMFPMDCQ